MSAITLVLSLHVSSVLDVVWRLILDPMIDCTAKDKHPSFHAAITYTTAITAKTRNNFLPKKMTSKIDKNVGMKKAQKQDKLVSAYTCVHVLVFNTHMYLHSLTLTCILQIKDSQASFVVD